MYVYIYIYVCIYVINVLIIIIMGSLVLLSHHTYKFPGFPTPTTASRTAEGQIDGHADGISHEVWDGRQSNDHHTQDVDGGEVQDRPLM